MLFTDRRFLGLNFIVVLVILSSGVFSTIPFTTTSNVFAQSADPIRFAVVGDYGKTGQAELDVANRIKSWNPEFIITTGDNNYEVGSAAEIDQNIGQYYHEFISPYTGSYGAGAATNLFFPALGNHDWESPNAQPYLNYFTLPGNERYYEFVRGPVHFFVVDSDSREPDGITSTSTQAIWLQNQLASSTSTWNLVYMHHPPYSSGGHGSTSALQWNYAAWGADVVLAGHDHHYERIFRNGIPYLVNGLGGASISSFGATVSGSQLRYNGNYGAMLVDASESQIQFQFITRTGVVIDSYTLNVSTPTPSPTVTSTLTRTATITTTPTYTPTITQTGTSTNTPTRTPTLTPTRTPTATRTNTATFTSTATVTQTPSRTPTLTPTSTPSPTRTITPSRTPTNTATYTSTFTPSATPSRTPTNTATRTNTATPTYTATSTPTKTVTSTRTPTPILPALPPFMKSAILTSPFLVTQSGSVSGSPPSLGLLQQNGVQDDPAAYVTFQTPGSVYTGYQSFYLPGEIQPSLISAMLMQINFKGPAPSAQTWTWSIYAWNTGQWIQLRDTIGLGANQWQTLLFRIAAPWQYISSAR